MNFFPNEEYKKIFKQGMPLLNNALDIVDIREEIKNLRIKLGLTGINTKSICIHDHS